MRTKLKNFLLALLLTAVAAPVAAGPEFMTFGFIGDISTNRHACDVRDCPDTDESTPVTGLFTIDINAPDLDPSNDIGRYVFNGGGTGFALTLQGEPTLFSDGLEIQVRNNEFGAWCDDHRDQIMVLSKPLPNFGAFLIFDSCDVNALTSDALIHTANLSPFGPLQQPNEGLVFYNHQASSFTGTAYEIFALSPLPGTRLPEPGMFVLLGIGAIAFAFARLKCIQPY